MGAKRRKSSRQSITNTRFQKRLKQVTFYLERSLGGRIILEELRKAGLKVEPHSKYFRPSTEDIDWLPVVGRNGWIVLMRDQRIGKRSLELEALLNGGVKAFVLVSGNLKNAENAAVFVKALPKMLSMIAQNDCPFIAKVSRQGTVKMWQKRSQRSKRRKRRRHK